jgi:hypothetical protein
MYNSSCLEVRERKAVHKKRVLRRRNILDVRNDVINEWFRTGNRDMTGIFVPYLMLDVFQIIASEHLNSLDFRKEEQLHYTELMNDYHRLNSLFFQELTAEQKDAVIDMFDVTGNYLYPRVSVTPILKRNGWNNSFLRLNISPVEISKALLSSPALEMLAKTQRELFLHLLRTGRTEFPVHAVKICNRNNYRIADPDIWLDHIDNLLRLNLDTHNAHYVCPADIYAEHERLANRIRSEEKKKELEARRAEMKKMETEYQETKGKFFGICFGNENIVVTVIQSVQEMEHEGTAMHHCVYVNEYYKKAHSLILSAKDKRGNRIETVEVNTQIFKVVQSRGVCNQNTPHHNEIINLVNNNMYRIRQAI